MRNPYRWLGMLALLIVAACGDSDGNMPSSPLTLTGNWSFSISAASCLSSVPSGYAVAPRGGGAATIVQDRGTFAGQLLIFNNPSGTIQGNVTGNTVQLIFNLDGRNVGTLSPVDEPCRVVGSGTGTTDLSCSISVRFSGDFACPYSCAASNDVLTLSRAGPGCGR
jgi:hypothetical protein